MGRFYEYIRDKHFIGYFYFSHCNIYIFELMKSKMLLNDLGSALNLKVFHKIRSYFITWLENSINNLSEKLCTIAIYYYATIMYKNNLTKN